MTSIFELGFKVLAHGELQGIATALQMPDISCQLVNFKAVNDNPSNVYIGRSSSVTVVTASTNTTAGWELDAGEETGWLPCANLNEFYRICDATGDDLVYICVG